MSAGRPTKLDSALVAKAETYVERCSTIGIHELLPTIEGLALEIGVDRDTVYAWEDVPELPSDATPEQEELHELRQGFSYIVKRLRLAQAQKLMQNSLVGRYNPIITKLLLSKHGYVEKSEVDQKLDAEHKISLKDKSDQELDEIINDYKQATSS